VANPVRVQRPKPRPKHASAPSLPRVGGASECAYTQARGKCPTGPRCSADRHIHDAVSSASCTAPVCRGHTPTTAGPLVASVKSDVQAAPALNRPHRPLLFSSRGVTDARGPYRIACATLHAGACAVGPGWPPPTYYYCTLLALGSCETISWAAAGAVSRALGPGGTLSRLA